MAEVLRTITVENQLFLWRFNETIVVIPVDRSSPQLTVRWGWRDWFAPEGAGAEPQIVTPRFVATAIRFALTNGWDPVNSRVGMNLQFADGKLQVSSAS